MPGLNDINIASREDQELLEDDMAKLLKSSKALIISSDSRDPERKKVFDGSRTYYTKASHLASHLANSTGTSQGDPTAQLHLGFDEHFYAAREEAVRVRLSEEPKWNLVVYDHCEVISATPLSKNTREEVQKELPDTEFTLWRDRWKSKWTDERPHHRHRVTVELRKCSRFRLIEDRVSVSVAAYKGSGHAERVDVPKASNIFHTFEVMDGTYPVIQVISASKVIFESVFSG